MKPTGIRRINFIEYVARINTLGSLGGVFPKYGSLLLATLLRDKGYEVRYYLEGVSPMDLDDITDADAVCLPVFAPALTKVRSLGIRIMELKPACRSSWAGRRCATSRTRCWTAARMRCAARETRSCPACSSA